MRFLSLGALAGALLLAAATTAQAAETPRSLAGFDRTATVTTFAGCGYMACFTGSVAVGKARGSDLYFAKLLSLTGTLFNPPHDPEIERADLNIYAVWLHAPVPGETDLLQFGLHPAAPGGRTLSSEPLAILGGGRLSVDVTHREFCANDPYCDSYQDTNVDIEATSITEVTVTPEPVTLALLVPGVAALLVARRRGSPGRSSRLPFDA